jgi:hypothetical protein
MEVRKILRQALAARRETGKGVPAQLGEIVRLRRDFGRLGPSEYYQFGLYDDRRFDFEAKRAFIGWKGERALHERMNNHGWWALSWDKLIFYSLLRAGGLPHPPIEAIYDPRGRFLDGVPTFRSRQTLADFLLGEATLPLFVKPSHGVYGRGAHTVLAADAANRTLTTEAGEVAVNAFIDGLDVVHSDGQIFQQRIRPHPRIAEACGDRPSSVRMLAMVTREGIAPVHAVWKIPTGGNIIDNFQHGRSGNLLGAVDIANGRIRRVVGMAAGGRIAERDRHPDTGEDLQGMRLPDWEAVRALTDAAGRLLPRYRILHFDIALTEDGPALLEVNLSGDCDLHQVASGKGLMNATFRKAVRDFEDYRERESRAKARVLAGRSPA